MSVGSQDGSMFPFWFIPKRLPKIWPTATEHDCPEFTGNHQSHSLLSAIQKNQESLPSKGLVSESNTYRLLYWQPKPSLRNRNFKIQSLRESTEASEDTLENRALKSPPGVLHGQGSEQAIPVFCCWRIYETLRTQGPYCNVITFCVIHWLQITAQGAKIAGRKQVIK